MHYLLEFDRELFLSLNSLHTPWLDPVIFLATKTVVWLPLYFWLFVLLVKQHKKNSWIPLLGAALTILLADQTTSSFMKPFFERLRPSHEPSLHGLVHLVNNYKGGLYGFASSHAANSFGVATFFFLLFRRKYSWMLVLFVWAALLSYTRIYLGVHYPGDILTGTLVGVASAWIGYMVTSFLLLKRVRNSFIQLLQQVF